MKRIRLLLIFVGLGMFIHASGWMHDYDKALTKAQQTHKPILMMYSAKT